MRYLAQILITLVMITGSAYSMAQCGDPVPKLCDADGDFDVDSKDIVAIGGAKGTPSSGPGDLRDVDGDGMITVLDARQCVSYCKDPKCSGPSEVPNEVVRGSLTPEVGVTLVVPGNASGMANAKIEIPADAAIEALEVQVGYEDAAPGPFRAEANDAGVTQVSKTLVLKVANGAPSFFNLPVTVTMPYDVALADGLPPVVLFWDPDANRYRAMQVIEVNAVAGTVTFLTAHFSSFVAAVVKRLKADMPEVDTGFQIGTDSILHQNFSSYQFGGLCAAFASMSSHYYGLRKATRLYDFAQEGADEQPSDDEITRSAMSITYTQLMSTKWQGLTTKPNTFATDTGQLMIEAMIITGEPVNLIFGNGKSGEDGAGHSVTVYGYDADNARFRIYDNNFPKIEVTYDWNLLTGFGTYSREDAYRDYDNIFKLIGYMTDSTFGAPAQFDKIINDWESGALQDYFDNLEISDRQGTQKLSYDKIVVSKIPYSDNQEITVHFTRPVGSINPVYMHVFLDGVKQSAEAPLIDASGDFKLSFPTKLEGQVEVILLVSEHARAFTGDYNSVSGFTAFGKFTVQPEGKNFFINLGLETGDTTGWTTATTQYGSTWTPTKLQVVGVGFDPIAKDIPTAIFGNFAARVNDFDPNYHVTYLAQKVTVPNTDNPQLVFQWAAVLEDPQHTPVDQPYVDVVVSNLSRGTELYRRRFFANDPTFNGWRDYQGGAWKAIPWQSVILTGLSSYAGDELELRVVGADCALGGHGGYVYFDGEE